MLILVSGQAENTELSEMSEMSEKISEKISEMSEMLEKISEKARRCRRKFRPKTLNQHERLGVKFCDLFLLA